MSGSDRQYVSEQPVDERHAISSFWVWYAAVTPPVAWGVHLLLTYFLEAWFCGANMSNTNLWLDISTAVLLAATVLAGLAGLWAVRAAGIGDDTSEATDWGISGFLGITGVITSILFGLAIIMGDFGVFYLSSCQPR